MGYKEEITINFIDKECFTVQDVKNWGFVGDRFQLKTHDGIEYQLNFNEVKYISIHRNKT